MERLSEMTPGALFILFFSLIVVSSPDTWPMISTFASGLFEVLEGQQGAVLISLNFIFLVFLISLIAALSFLIDKTWDFLFYFGGGYDKEEYIPMKEKLLELLPEDSKFRSEIERKKCLCNQSMDNSFTHLQSRLLSSGFRGDGIRIILQLHIQLVLFHQLVLVSWFCFVQRANFLCTHIV
jgi:hypothetical protein